VEQSGVDTPSHHDPARPDLPEALRGPRVLLRRLQPDDAAAAWEAIEESRDRLAPWMPWVASLKSADDERAHIARMRERWDRREDLTMGIFEASTGRYLGGSGLHRVDWELRTFEIGYWLRTSAEGRGYARETVQVLTRLAFRDLRAVRVEIQVDPRNIRSLRVPQRLGFVLEGTLRRVKPDGQGRPSDRQVFAVLEEDYRRLPWTAGSPG
jgi:RimJ/RimL family protein N-acetyltransferase